MHGTYEPYKYTPKYVVLQSDTSLRKVTTPSKMKHWLGYMVLVVSTVFRFTCTHGAGFALKNTAHMAIILAIPEVCGCVNEQSFKVGTKQAPNKS